MENNYRNPECMKHMQCLYEIDFFITDLTLYLDTHPEDEKAIEMLKEACKQKKMHTKEFEECCYPLTPCGAKCDCEWDWLFGVWPPFSL